MKPHSPKIYKEMSEDELLAHFLALHFLHKISPLFRSMLDSAELVQYLAELVGPNVKCMQSMLFVKNLESLARLGMKMSIPFRHVFVL